MAGPTAAERDAALRWAAAVRKARAALRRDVGAGRCDLADVLDRAATDPLVGQVRLSFLLESLPGARKVDTRRHLLRLGLDGDLPLSELDDGIRQVVLREFPMTSRVRR